MKPIQQLRVEVAFFWPEMRVDRVGTCRSGYWMISTNIAPMRLKLWQINIMRWTRGRNKYRSERHALEAVLRHGREHRNT